jgi:hypothetical protein
VNHLRSEVANCEDVLKSLPFEKNHPMVQTTQAKVQELREQLMEATKAVQQQPAEEMDLDLKAKRDVVKVSIAKVKKLTCMDEKTHAAMIQGLEEELEKLQPQPKAQSVHNQLRKAQVLEGVKQEERSDLIKVKEKIQKEIEAKQQLMAKIDRSVANIDSQLIELGGQIDAWVVEVKARPNAQQPRAEEEEKFSISWFITRLGPQLVNCTVEELRARLVQEPETDQGAPSQDTTLTGAMDTETVPPVQRQNEEVSSMGASGGGGAASTTVSNRSPGGNPGTRAINRGKPKDIPVVSTEQRAAPLKAAAGLAREERLRAARAVDASELGSEIENEIAARQEEEKLHQTAP